VTEQHIYKIEGDENQGIVYIFNVDRQDNKIMLKSIWIVVIHNGYETKIILDIPGLMRDILLTPEMAADVDQRKLIKEWFDEMQLAKGEYIGADMADTSVNEILEAADKAKVIPSKYDDIVKEMLSAKKP
jgi:hypothetical protein